MDENPLSSDNPQSKLLSKVQPVAVTLSEMAEAVAPPAGETPASLPSNPDEAAKMDFLWHTHQYLGEYARFGDTKAAFAGTSQQQSSVACIVRKPICLCYRHLGINGPRLHG